MISFATTALNTLSAHGEKHSQLEEKGQEVISNLLTLRKQGVVDFLSESQLIETLQETEKQKNNASIEVATKMIYDAAKSLFPSGEIVKATCDAFFGTALRYSDENQNGLPQNFVASLIDVSGKKICSTLMSEAKNLFMNFAGTATAAITAPALLVSGSLLLAKHPTLVNSCRKFVSNSGKGGLAILQYRFKIFQDNTNKNILSSYKLYTEKKVELFTAETAKKEKASEIAIAKASLKELQNDLAKTKEELENRRTHLLGLFVLCFNKSDGFNGFFTRLFSSLSSRFRNEKIDQEKMCSNMAQQSKRIQKKASQVNMLKMERKSLEETVHKIKLVVDEREQSYLSHLNKTS